MRELYRCREIPGVWRCGEDGQTVLMALEEDFEGGNKGFMGAVIVACPSYRERVARGSAPPAWYVECRDCELATDLTDEEQALVMKYNLQDTAG